MYIYDFLSGLFSGYTYTYIYTDTYTHIHMYVYKWYNLNYGKFLEGNINNGCGVVALWYAFFFHLSYSFLYFSKQN